MQSRVPNIGSPDFVAEARRQSAAVATSSQAIDDQEFIDAVSDRGDSGTGLAGPAPAN
jgi:hypothetical protein